MLSGLVFGLGSCAPKTQSDGFDIHGPQGGISYQISVPKDFNPDTDKCPMVLLMHGFMGQKEGMTDLAVKLASQGIASIRFDFDAHGESEGDFVNMTLSSEVADARAVLEYVKTLPYVDQVAFVGHSQGGVIAGLLAGELEKDENLRPKCVVLMAPAAVLKDDAIKGVCMGNEYDPQNPPEYVDIFGHHLGHDFIVEAQKYPIYETSCQYTGKVCIVHGVKDFIVPLSYGQKYDELYSDSVIHVLENEDHSLAGDRVGVLDIVSDFICESLRADDKSTTMIKK